MPNKPLVVIRKEAIAKAGKYLASLAGGQFIKLGEEEFPEKKSNKNVAAWKGTITCGTEQVEIIVGLPFAFPDDLPNIYLVDHTIPIPHLTTTRDNHVCFANSEEVLCNPDRPADIIVDSLQRACETIKQGLSGLNHQDFETEFEAYWADSLTEEWWTSILNPGGEPRIIARLYSDKSILGSDCLVGESEEQCRTWMVNTGFSGACIRCEKILYLPLKKVFRPPFPVRNLDIYKLLKGADPNAVSALCDYLTKHNARRFNRVVFSVPVRGGLVLGGWVHLRPTLKRRRKALCPGFRNGRIPGKVQLTTCFPNQGIMRAEVMRADPVRLQARVGSRRGAGLLEKTILIVGCGSIGCRIANMMALSGVGKLLLVDKEGFTVENIARHVLPAKYVGDNKAEALASMLKSQSPHLEVEHYDGDFQELMSDRPDVLEQADLVVAATGNKNLEFRLNSILRSGDGAKPAIYAWTEARGIASHTILVIPDEGGCLRCCYQYEANSVQFKYAVDTRLASEVLINEEGCRSTFQPFSALVAEQAALLAAKMAISYLHGDLVASYRWHHLGDLDSAREDGIPISSHYRRYPGEQTIKVRLPRHPNCPECKR